jgi:hypothetical protein
MGASRVAKTCLVAATIVLAAKTAYAIQPAEASPSDLEHPPSRPLVAFGEPVVACGWPTVVAVVGSQLCTGTLIYPELVVYSGQCGGDEDNKVIRFGEDAFDGGQVVEVEYCSRWDLGLTSDWGHCRLAQPITDVPVTPPLFGCDLDELAAGDPAVLVGFGATDLGGAGQKHWAATSIEAIDRTAEAFSVGLPGVDETPFGCSGDAGAPVFVEVGDGSWRIVGIVSSTSDTCDSGNTSTYILIENVIRLLEVDTGLDLTPCHSSDGSWAPGPECTGYSAQSADSGSGSWENWCLGTPTSGDSSSCGPAWDDFDPTLGPEVLVTYPHWGQHFEKGTEVEVEVVAHKHPEGFAVRRVSVAVNGYILGTQDDSLYIDNTPPLTSDGVYSVVAYATDWAGNVTPSEPVKFAVGNAVVPDESDGPPKIDPLAGDVVRCTATTGVSGWWVLGLALLGLRVKNRGRVHLN